MWKVGKKIPFCLLTRHASKGDWMQVFREPYRSFRKANAPEYCSASVDRGVACSSDIARHVRLETHERAYSSARHVHEYQCHACVSKPSLPGHISRSTSSLAATYARGETENRPRTPTIASRLLYPSGVAPGASRRSTVRKCPR